MRPRLGAAALVLALGLAAGCGPGSGPTPSRTATPAPNARPARRTLGRVLASGGPQFYVSPTGSAAGDGSIGNPWDLQTALHAQPATLPPGSTVWIRGGLYTAGAYGGAYGYEMTTKGTLANPIVFQEYPGERATLDAYSAAHGHNVYGLLLIDQTARYTKIVGIEMKDSAGPSLRGPSGTGTPSAIWANSQDVGFAIGIDIVNCVIHDFPGQGLGFWAAHASTMYGNDIFYNGYYPGASGNAHGVYFSNFADDPFKRIADNIFFDSQGYNIHGFSWHTPGDANFNTTIEGNVTYSSRQGGNLLVGTDEGSPRSDHVIIRDNLGWQPNSQVETWGSLALGLRIGIDHLTFERNFFVGGDNRIDQSFNGTATVTGNELYGWIFQDNVPNRPVVAEWPGNTFAGNGAHPAITKVLVRPNEYEAGRGNVGIYNGTLASTVPVDLSSVLAVGATYKVLYAANFYGSPVLTGTYAGGTVNFPMTGLVKQAPIGSPALSDQAPEFAAFIVRTTSGAGPIPTPTVTLTRTITPTPTITPTGTITPTVTMTRTATRTKTPVGTPPGPIYTVTKRPTKTPTVTRTITPTPTRTQTRTPVPLLPPDDMVMLRDLGALRIRVSRIEATRRTP